jgi:hypothetical protein
LIQYYDLFEEEIPAGTKYIAVKSTSPTEDACLLIDEFAVYNVLVPMGEWQYANNVTSPATITGLEDDTWYEWQVQGNNTVCTGDTTAWSVSDYFVTEKAYRQTIALSEGSNYVSFNVETNLNTLKAALVEAFPNEAIIIKSKNQTHTYNPKNHRWAGSFAELDLSKMYIINVVSAGELTLQGYPVDPADHPATINHGSNYLAFPLNVNMTPTDAFAGFAANGDKIKSKNETCPYTRGRWGNQISTLEPGKGYIYVGADNQGDGRIFVYPANSNRGAQKTVQTPKMHIFPDASKATLKAMQISKIDKSKRASVSSMKVLDKKTNTKK